MRNASFKFIFVLLCVSSYSWAQTEQSKQINIAYRGDRNYTLIERTNLRRYDNDKYIGLVSKEVRSFITNISSPEDRAKGLSRYDGNFFVMEQTKRQNRNVATGIQEAIPSVFTIDSEGKLVMQEDNGYPSFRSFPAYPSKQIKEGDSWQASAVRAVDPLNKGIITRMPIFIEYKYEKKDILHGEDVYVVSARWATRYGMRFHIDFSGDPDIVEAQVSHKAILYISTKTGGMIQANDIVDEYFVYSDGLKVAFKGTISLFTEYPPSIDRSRIIHALQRVASIDDEKAKELEKKTEIASNLPSSPNDTNTNTGFDDNSKNTPAIASIQNVDNKGNAKKNGGESEGNTAENITKDTATGNSKQQDDKRGKKASDSNNSSVERLTSSISNGNDDVNKNITVDNTEAGIRLTIQNLQFKPDSAELLQGEEKRLDQIASVLKEVEGGQFLVEGHTASTGNPRGEQQLSEERARSIVQALIKRGLSANQFICKGSGGRKPIADNSTASGKAKNRRVEITILE